MATQIPPLLESCLSLPPETSQIVLTGILGASTNWLVLRYLHSLLKPVTTTHRSQHGDGSSAGQEDVRVVLVSWMRDYAFWKDGGGRLVMLPPFPPPPAHKIVENNQKLTHIKGSQSRRPHHATQILIRRRLVPPFHRCSWCTTGGTGSRACVFGKLAHGGCRKVA